MHETRKPTHDSEGFLRDYQILRPFRGEALTLAARREGEFRRPSAPRHSRQGQAVGGEVVPWLTGPEWPSTFRGLGPWRRPTGGRIDLLTGRQRATVRGEGHGARRCCRPGHLHQFMDSEFQRMIVPWLPPVARSSHPGERLGDDYVPVSSSCSCPGPTGGDVPQGGRLCYPHPQIDRVFRGEKGIASTVGSIERFRLSTAGPFRRNTVSW